MNRVSTVTGYMMSCDPAGARTQDPHIKSVMLYLLSYQVIELLRSIATAKILLF